MNALLRLALLPAPALALDFGAFAVRIIVHVCSVQEWRYFLEPKFLVSLAAMLNNACSIVPERCNLREWNSAACRFTPMAIEYMNGYPKRIDDFHLELQIFVSHSSCCYHSGGKPHPMLAPQTLLDFIRHDLAWLQENSGVKIAYVEQPVGTLERILRRWTFTLGLGVVAFVILAGRLYLKHRERRKWISDYWKKTVQKSKKPIQDDFYRKHRQSFLVGTGGLKANRWLEEEPEEPEQRSQLSKKHQEEMKKKYIKRMEGRNQTRTVQDAQPHHRTAALMLFRRRASDST